MFMAVLLFIHVIMDANIVDILTLIIALIALVVTLYNNWKVIKMSQSGTRMEVRSQLTQLFINVSKLGSDIYVLQAEFNEKKTPDIQLRLNNAKNERGVAIEQIIALISKNPEFLTYAEYSEVAKNLFSMFNYEGAKTYHLEAISRSHGIAQIVCRRCYADFLYQTNDLKGGKRMYELSVLKEANDNLGFITNGHTFRMWMNNEIYAGNLDEAKKHYQSSLTWFEKIVEDFYRKQHLGQVKNDARNYLSEDNFV